MTINQFMTADHRACDEQFANLENIVDDGNFEIARMMFDEFREHMLHHFQMEEEVMFDEYNKNGQGHCNPTEVMIIEHDQMRNVFKEMSKAIDERDKNKFLGFSENLLFTMQQHNMKEEQMMYSLADESLDSEDIINRMKAI
jgi:DUF438 domain-containing protein